MSTDAESQDEGASPASHPASWVPSVGRSGRSARDGTMTRLGCDGRAIEAFEEALAKVGWHEGLRQTGSLLRFNLNDVHFFEVAGDFPRLPDDYVPPRGVVGVLYVVDTSSQPSLRMEHVIAAARTLAPSNGAMEEDRA